MFFTFGLVVIALSVLLSKVMLKTAKEIELVDKPNERSSHVSEIPKGGGLVFSGLFMLVCVYLYLFQLEFKPYVTPLLISGPALFGLGWIDDRLRLSATIRLFVHVFVGGAVLFSLTRGLSLPFQVLFVPNWFPLTLFFCILYMTWFVNLYNFMDGADGIAGGVGLIGAFAMAGITYQEGVTQLSVLYFILGCSLVGFLYFNWNPAKFFMGDSGAYFLGITFAVLSLVGKVEADISLFPTIIIFGLFIVDATYTLISRVSQGFNPYTPHRQFGFHKLFARGWSHGQAARLYLAIVLFWLVPLGVLCQYFPNYDIVLLIVSYIPLIGFEVYIKAGKG